RLLPVEQPGRRDRDGGAERRRGPPARDRPVPGHGQPPARHHRGPGGRRPGGQGPRGREPRRPLVAARHASGPGLRGGIVSKENALGNPELPQVNLLPPEVRAKRAAGHARRWMHLALAIAVAVSGLAYAYAFMEANTASKELATAEEET